MMTMTAAGKEEGEMMTMTMTAAGKEGRRNIGGGQAQPQTLSLPSKRKRPTGLSAFRVAQPTLDKEEESEQFATAVAATLGVRLMRKQCRHAAAQV